jgi:hypothetical protein
MKKPADRPLICRQGDVIAIEITPPAPERLQPAPKDPRGLVLAEGESSGHHHQVFGRGCKLFAFRDASNSARVLTVGQSGAELRVVGGGTAGRPRHELVKLPGGKSYEIRTQRQWTAEDEMKSRAVED